MHMLIGRLAALAVLALFLAATVSWTAEERFADDKAGKSEKVPENKIPAKVMAAVKARFPAAKLDKVSKETTRDGVVYDIELTQKGRKYEMDIKEDGTVLEVEKEVFIKDAPKAVLDALKARYPKAKIKVIMEVNKVKGKKETPDHYEVTLETADKKELEVLVSLDGKSVKGGGDEKKKE
jgi:uncharacterized membrane protein YkoI